jgi:DNA-binding transcriptional ArsR family regulator
MLNFERNLDPTQLDAVFYALADERRRDMVERLAWRPMTVSELAEPVGLRLPSAVKHLAVLEAGGIVVSKKVGRIRTYQLEPDALNALGRWLDQRRAALNAAFDRLEQAIADFPEDEEQ